MEFCLCGCGTILDFTKGRKIKRYVKGHAARVNNQGGKSRKGKKPWNYNIPRTEEEKKNISNAIKIGKKNSTYNFSDEHRKKISESLSKIKRTKKWSNNIIESREQNPNYEKTKKQISDTLKAKYKNGDLISPFFIDGRCKFNPNSQYNLYGGEFTDNLKKEVRLRDNYTCQLCGKKRCTITHHIDYNKLNNVKHNLIILCRSCHAKHHNKNHPKKTEEITIFVNKIKEYYDSK